MSVQNISKEPNQIFFFYFLPSKYSPFFNFSPRISNFSVENFLLVIKQLTIEIYATLKGSKNLLSIQDELWSEDFPLLQLTKPFQWI